MAVIPPNAMADAVEDVDFSDQDEFHADDEGVIENFEDVIEEEVIEEDGVDYEHYGAMYLARIRGLYKAIPILNPSDYEIVRRCLENLLVPSCEFLIMHAHSVPNGIQDAMNAISLHMADPESFIEHPSHAEQYLLTLERAAERSLVELSIFSKDHAIREQEQASRAAEERAAEQNEKLLNAMRYASSYGVEFMLFLFKLEALRRGDTTEHIYPISKALQMFHDERIPESALQELSKDELDCLLLDGDSEQAVAIVENLVESSTSKLTI